MTPDLTAELVKELKKMNGFLEAIDWKLWNMHKKFVEEGVVVTAEKPVATATTTTATDAPTEVAVPSIPKYPSIEKWSS